jgi:hypothetical protein
MRQQLSISKATNTVKTPSLVSRVVSQIGHSDTFHLGQHIIDSQDGVDNHHYNLVRLIAMKYITIRQYHIAKLHTLRMHSSNVRHHLTKTIIFKGQ